jgi:uncharacterized protein
MSRVGLSVAAVVLLAIVYLVVIYTTQRSILFPAPSMLTTAHDPRAELVRLSSHDGPVEALFLSSTAGLPGPAPLLVFTHGNAELADDWVDVFGVPRAWGWAVLLVEYPGYGRSAGTPSEASITAAALAAFDWALKDPRIDPKRIVAYGRSLGGGAASRLAAERPVAALVLESSFTSVRAFATRLLAPGFMVRDPFDNLEALRSYRGPMLVVHGVDDDIVPISHGRALAAAVPGAEFHEVACAHNDCPRPWPILRSFLAAHGLDRSALTADRMLR